MNFKAYQHIEKLGSTEVERILSGTCYLSYKIDGTNGLIYLSDDLKNLKFGSRKRELTKEEDNANFLNNITANQELYNDLFNYLTKHPTYIIYGEWLVPHTIKKYKEDAWKKFYIFDIYDTENDKYINYDIYSDELNKYKNINYIPLIAKLENPTVDDIKALLNKTGSYLITDGLGEGIVIKNYEFINKYGRTTWAKILTEDFTNNKKHSRINNSEEKLEYEMEHKIISLLTLEHIHKEYNKLIESKGDWSSNYIFELLNRVFMEFIHDNIDIIINKFHNPTINFRVLKQLSDNKVKETLNL